MNTPPKFWHWPDHVAGKRETRRLREEHNAAKLHAIARKLPCLPEEDAKP